MSRDSYSYSVVLAILLLGMIFAPAISAQSAAASGANASPEVSSLIAQLGSPELQSRRDAARRLAAIQPMPAEVIRALANFLQTAEKNDASQRYAILGLAKAGAPALPAATRLLGSPNAVTCEAAEEILDRMALTVPAASPILIARFKKSPFGPWPVAYELAHAGPPVVPLLVRALKDPDPSTRMGAAATLAEMANFARLYKDASAQARRQSGVVLATSRDLAPAAPELADALNDRDPEVRNWAAVALAYANPADARSIPILVQLLDDNNFIIRDEATSALENMGSAARSAAPALERALASNPNVDVRVGAARALLPVAGRDACGALAHAVGTDTAPNVRVWAARSLVAIHPRCARMLPVLLETLGNSAYSATGELAGIGAPAVPGLLAALKSGNLYVRQDSVTALARMKPMPPEAKRALMVALNDKSLDVRSAAASALLDAGGAAQRAAQAETAREEKIYAQESKPDMRTYTGREIAAPVPADPNHVYPLSLSYLVPVVATEEPIRRAQFLIALYSGRDRPERLVFWRKVGPDAYRKAVVVQSQDPDFREEYYEVPDIFTAKVRIRGQEAQRERTQLFVDVPVDGWRSHTDQLFAVVGGKLHSVRIQSAQKIYQPKLTPREIIWYPAYNSFSDDELKFSMSIWNDDDPMCCPNAGDVTGTYMIIETPAAPGARPTWMMLVASAKREMRSPQPRLPKKRREDKLAIWTREAGHGSPPTLSELLAALKSADLQDRNAAAIMLMRMKPLPAVAIPALVEALSTPDPQNRFQFSVFDALGDGGAAAVPFLAQLAHSDDPMRQRVAFQALGRIGLHEPAAWPILINGLKSAGADAAQSALANIGAPIVPLLRKSLEDPDPRIRAGAAAALVSMASVTRMIGKLPPLSLPPTLAFAALSVLETAKPDLTEALHDPNSNVRSQAAVALASIDPADTRTLPVLVALIGSSDPALRITALRTLQLMGSAAKEAIPPVERALQSDPDPGTRGQAARTLAEIAGTRACPTLARAAANDKSAAVRGGMMAAMAQESPACDHALPDLIAALGRNQVADRTLTCYSLARLGNAAVPRLAAALKSPDLHVREDAVRALGQMNPLTPEAADALLIALNDKSIGVRSMAAEALQNAQGEPKHAGAVELKRERRLLARQSKPDARRYRKEEIIAPASFGAGRANPITLACLLPSSRDGGSADNAPFLASVYRLADGAERVAFWRRTGDDQYQSLKLVGSMGPGLVVWRVGLPIFFVVKVESSWSEWSSFVDVPGFNGEGRRDRVFVFGGDHVNPVEIESPEKWYQGKLGKNEIIRGPVANSFANGELKFAFSIWKAGDPPCCPTAGRVVGTYKVEIEPPMLAISGGLGLMSASGAYRTVRGVYPLRPTEPAWKLVVAAAERKAIGSLSVVPPHSISRSF